MRFFSKPAPVGATDPVSEIIARLWQTKLRSISLLEDWLPQVADFGVRAGLQAHLAEERRHQRLFGAEISRRNGRQTAAAAGSVLDRPFAIVREQTDDIARVKLFHQGIKASTVLYSARVIPYVEPSLARVLEQVTRDEERHIRWAEIRLAASETPKSARQLDPAMREMQVAMEAVWSRPWRRLTQSSYGLGRAG
jgi:hypothetical protein